MGVAVYKPGHDDAPGGVDLPSLARPQKIFNAPAGTDFHYAPVLEQQGAIADNPEFAKSEATSGLTWTMQRQKLARSPHKDNIGHAESLLSNIAGCGARFSVRRSVAVQNRCVAQALLPAAPALLPGAGEFCSPYRTKRDSPAFSTLQPAGRPEARSILFIRPRHAASLYIRVMPHPPRRPLKTLERVLSKAGLGSRTEARSWIDAGRVGVNGKVVRTPDHWVDFARDRVTLDGQPVRAGEKIYLLLYKPKGYITTSTDPEGRPTVYDLIRDAGVWLVPVGRLDLDTTGLLIMTNDTQFAERLTNPDYKVPKTYHAKCADLLSDEQIERLRRGVELSDGPTRPALVERLRDSGKYTHLEITLMEGRNRQVRRMVEAAGSKVLKLVRVAIGEVRIGDLPIGKWRLLTATELLGLVGQALPPANPHRRTARNS